MKRDDVHERPPHRLPYIDWLRVLVISLVVAHHAAQAYGPTGGAWPVSEPERTALLGPFFPVNAGFMMGLFFLISGYFVPGSLARKGSTRFVLDRLVRLGVPLVVIGFGVFALVGYGGAGGGRGFLAYYRDTYIGNWEVEFGPLWFVFHLLLYSIVYAVLAKAFPALTTDGRRPAMGHGALVALVAVIAVAGGVARTAYSQDTWVHLFGVIPAEPAHLPQYVVLFALGTVAGRHRWFDTIPRAVGGTWLRIGLAAAVLWYALRYLDSYAGIRLLDGPAMGVLFPFWEAVLCVGLCVGLVVHAREHWARPSRWLAGLAGATYGVYLLHVFIVVGLNMAFLGLPFPPFAKFLLVTAATLPVGFAAAMALSRIPGVARVL